MAQRESDLAKVTQQVNFPVRTGAGMTALMSAPDSLHRFEWVVYLLWVSRFGCLRQPQPPPRVLRLQPPASGHCGTKWDLVSFCHSLSGAEKKEHSGLAPCSFKAAYAISLGHSIFLPAGPLALPPNTAHCSSAQLARSPPTSSRQLPLSSGLCPGSQPGLSMSLPPLPLCR